MIACIDLYFHPLGAIDTLGYIFQLIDIMQGANEPVITLIGGPAQKMPFFYYAPRLNLSMQIYSNMFKECVPLILLKNIAHFLLYGGCKATFFLSNPGLMTEFLL
jgi:hypothetical protein